MNVEMAAETKLVVDRGDAVVAVGRPCKQHQLLDSVINSCKVHRQHPFYAHGGCFSLLLDGGSDGPEIWASSLCCIDSFRLI